MKRTKITDALIKNIIETYKKVRNVVETAKILDISHCTVSKYLNKTNTVVRDSRIKDLKLEEVLILIDKGLRLKDIAKKLNCNITTINNLLRKNKIKSARYVYMNVFEDLKHQNVQYWIGMLASDGCLSDTNYISISLKDKEHVEKYKNFCGVSNKIRESTKDNKYVNYVYKFSNPIMAEFLNNIGITPRKSLTLKLNIPITWHLLRGLVDGDGTFSVSKNGKKYYWGICTGSEAHQNQILEFLNTYNIHPNVSVSSKNHKNPMYELRISRKLDLFKLIILLYDNADTYLERKYHTAQYIINDILKTSSKFREPALGILSEIGKKELE